MFQKHCHIKKKTNKFSKIHSFDFSLVNSTLFVHVPTPSSSTSTTSPSLSQRGGVLPIPTPCGLYRAQAHVSNEPAVTFEIHNH